MKWEDYKNIRELKNHAGYLLYRVFLDDSIEAARLNLEAAKDEDVYRLQGQIAAFREIVRMFDNVDEYIRHFEPENL